MVMTGLAMTQTLRPIEGGLRLRDERRLAHSARIDPSTNEAVEGTGKDKDDVVHSVGRP